MKISMFRGAIVIASLVGAATTAWAGLSYTVTSRSNNGGGEGSFEVHLDVLVSGANAKAVFATPMPGVGEGSWLLTQDGGAKTFVVDPVAKTYSKWSFEQLHSDLDAMQKAMGSMVKFRTENVKVEDLGDDDGGVIEGFTTRHHHIRVSYDRVMKVVVMKKSVHMVIEDEMWTTNAVADAGAGIWRIPPPKIPDDDGDQAVAKVYGKCGGFLVKLSRKETSSGGHGGDQPSTETVVVSNVKQVDAQPDAFSIPAGFTETQGNLMRPQGGSQMPDLPPQQGGSQMPDLK